MSDPSKALAEYLSALEARDKREQAHARYINAYTKLADRTAAQAPPSTDDAVAPSPSLSTKSLRPGTPKGKSAQATQDTNSPNITSQLRSELASTQKIRADLESKLSAQTTELQALQTTDAEQKKRIIALEKVMEHLQRRLKDRGEELTGKGRLVEDVQDEMVALNLQLSMAEQERDKLKKENEDLTRRWVEYKEKEVQRQNEENDRFGMGGRRRMERVEQLVDNIMEWVLI
ncbi:autophagy protein 16 [Polyplosphaeria fusca]|uniref:Autophagy protein 16 n=1 Tax=Polyplosphaeria fusca TaxID=682080 RepID=A0A9P4V2A5_9PLEO|nr:autophagy protein 16 [Polyplosphaeria fusca]